MGAWGFGIFDDDTACDVREAYNQLLAEGASGATATRVLRRDWKEIFDDDDDGPVAWLALAASQWKVGLLEERIKSKALKLIDTGKALVIWGETPKLLQRRQAALQQLRDMLLSKQPPEKKFAIRKPASGEWNNWMKGEYFSYRIKQGCYALLQVQEVSSFRNRKHPTFAVLDWFGSTIPSASEIKKLPLIDVLDLDTVRRSDKEIPIDRLTRLGIKSKAKGFNGAVLVEWKELPRRIKMILKLK